jgi:hypothetical protein
LSKMIQVRVLQVLIFVTDTYKRLLIRKVY